MKKIFVIEDDVRLAAQLVKVLSENSYTARACESIMNYEIEFDELEPDLVLLDINLKVTNGYAICTEIRKRAKLPIIFITGRDSEEDEIHALNLGGDDYLRKPFSDAILLAHVDRLMQAHSFEYKTELSYRNIELNLGKRLVINTETGAEAELSGTEFQIIFYLMGRTETIVSREEIIDYLWTNRCYIDENALNVNLSRLRGKLSQAGLNQMLQSVKGEGLCLCSPSM